MSPAELEAWLRAEDPALLGELWARADAVRRRRVGAEVHLRGLVELSNHCEAGCLYCGIRRGRPGLARYRLGREEVLAAGARAAALGCGTVVLQGGQDPGLTAAALAGLVAALKAATGLAVTLSLGERPFSDYRLFRQAGADRYLLKFESSDPELYGALRPGAKLAGRLAHLARLREEGYEVGSGFLVGLPGQGYAALAGDLALCRELALEMVAVGPFLPHPATPLGAGLGPRPLPPGEQVPATPLMALKALALARLLCPGANLPGTTALAVLDPAGGRADALRCGANVIMLPLTPAPWRRLYEIYPGKGEGPDAAACRRVLADLLDRMGRRPGEGPGGTAAPRRQGSWS